MNSRAGCGRLGEQTSLPARPGTGDRAGTRPLGLRAIHAGRTLSRSWSAPKRRARDMRSPLPQARSAQQVTRSRDRGGSQKRRRSSVKLGGCYITPGICAERTRGIVDRAHAAVGAMGGRAPPNHSRQPLALRHEPLTAASQEWRRRTRFSPHIGYATKRFSGNALSTTSRKARTLAPTRRRELCNAQISTVGPACVPQ